MENTITKKRSGRIKLAIMCVAMMNQGATMISPALSAFAKAFPDAGTVMIQSLVTLPSLISIPFMVVAGLLSGKMSKKNMAVMGLVIFNVGGLLPFFLDNIVLIFICRMIMGAGIGFISPLASALVGDNFKGMEMTRMFGLNSVAMCIGSMLCSYLAGLLAKISYNAAFLCYLVGLAAMIIVIVLLPQDKASPDRERSGGLKDYLSITPDLWMRYLFQLTFCLAYFAYFTNTSLLIDQRGLGDTQFSGLTTSICHVAGIIAGLVLPKFKQKLGKYMLPTMLFVMMAGMFTELSAQSIWIMNLASFLIGFSYQIIMPYMVGGVTEAAKGLNYTVTSSLFTMAISTGAAASSVVLGNLARVIGFAELEGQLYLSITLLAILIIAVFIYRKQKGVSS